MINKKIKIFTKKNNLKLFLKKNKNFQGFYFDISNFKNVNEKIFNKANLREAKLKKIYQNREYLVKAYVNFISSLSKKNNSKAWWCSEHTSRNRFTSNLSNILISYIQCIKVIKKYDQSNLIIFIDDSNLKKYLENYLYPQNSFILKFNNLFLNVRHVVKLIIGFFRLFYRSLIIKLILRKLILNEKNENYLIKSHFYNSSIIPNHRYRDSFFNDLPNYFSKDSSTLYLVHIQENLFESLTSIKNITDTKIYPFEYFLNLKDIFLTLMEIFLQKNFNFSKAQLFDVDVSLILEKEYKLKPVSIGHLSIFHSVKNLSKLYKFKKTFLTYENIAWESSYIQGFKIFSPKTKIIGYQHTVVPQASLGMFIGKDEAKLKPLPHKIITTGVATKKIIKRYSNHNQSNVFAGCALRYPELYNEKVKKKFRKKIKNVLVALEGIPESSRLIDLIASQKASLNKYNITIRTHKVLPWDKLKTFIRAKREDIELFKISKNVELMDDLKSSDVCIYWGSTVCIEALSIGLPIINFNKNDIFSYDPLFQCNNLKWSLSEKELLINIIDNINNLDNESLEFEKKKAMKYIQNYLTKIDSNKMRVFTDA